LILFFLILIIFTNTWLLIILITDYFPNPYFILILLYLLQLDLPFSLIILIYLVLNQSSRLNSLLNDSITLHPLYLSLLEYLQYLLNTVLELLNGPRITLSSEYVIIQCLDNCNLIITHPFASMFNQLIMNSLQILSDLLCLLLQSLLILHLLLFLILFIYFYNGILHIWFQYSRILSIDVLFLHSYYQHLLIRIR